MAKKTTSSISRRRLLTTASAGADSGLAVPHQSVAGTGSHHQGRISCSSDWSYGTEAQDQCALLKSPLLNSMKAAV
jgi:hypothetical protein